MLEILGQATNPTVIQTHLKKLFAGLNQVKFDDKNEFILAMKSLEGEIVPLINKVKISHQVEVSTFAFANDFLFSFCISKLLYLIYLTNRVG